LPRPATAFAEPNPKKGEGDAPSEIWFEVTDQADGFAFAGIWRPWEGDWNKDRAASSSEVFAFLTTAPNELVGAVHPKAMPVILPRSEWSRWLETEWSDAKALQSAYAPSAMSRI
jgi:putative SOS response-associated peptidase YedK